MRGIKLDDDISNFLEPVHPAEQFHRNISQYNVFSFDFNFPGIFLFIVEDFMRERPCFRYGIKGVGLEIYTVKRFALLIEVFATECLTPQGLTFDNASRRRCKVSNLASCGNPGDK
jgi:hypothetical protein